MNKFTGLLLLPRARSITIKKHIFDFSSQEELADFLSKKGFATFRAKQIFDWVYDKLVVDFSLMSNLPESLKALLSKELCWDIPEVISLQKSVDGSQKAALHLADQGIVESVLMSAGHRRILCISTQVGCKMGCKFCATGKQGFVRSLSPSEIVAQIFWAAKECKEQGTRLSNLVYMGMGEPLDNYQATLFSIRSAKKFFAIGAKRIVVSTCGLPVEIVRLAKEEPNLKLAISLHSALQKNRSTLLPIGKKFTLLELKKALHFFAKCSPFKLTFEYILLPEVNMDRASARALISYVSDLPAKLNFIPYNVVEGLPYATPTQKEIENFCSFFAKSNIPYTLRNSLGAGVQAACGQLAGNISQ